MNSLEITPSGLEEASITWNDMVLCLDEFGAALATPKLATELITRLAYQTREGRGKLRSSAGQKSLGYEHARFCVATLTSSENPLDQMMGDQKREAGAQMRYVDVFVPDVKDGGAFPPLVREKYTLESDRLATILENTLDNNYGTALPAFIRHLISAADAQETLIRYHDVCVGILRHRCPGLQKRYYESFAKVYAAGRLASEARIAPFKVNRLERAILNLFDRTAAVTSAQEKEGKDALATLVALGNDPGRCVRQKKGTAIDSAGGRVQAVICARKGVPVATAEPAAPSGRGRSTRHRSSA